MVAGEQRREAVDDGWQSVGDRREADLRREAHKLFFFCFFSFVREENRREIGERSEDPGWRSSGGQEKARRAGTTLASAKKKKDTRARVFFFRSHLDVKKTSSSAHLESHMQRLKQAPGRHAQHERAQQGLEEEGRVVLRGRGGGEDFDLFFGYVGEIDVFDLSATTSAIWF